MARKTSASPLLLLGTTIFLLSTAACIILYKHYHEIDFDIDMSDEDGSEYS